MFCDAAVGDRAVCFVVLWVTMQCVLWCRGGWLESFRDGPQLPTAVGLLAQRRVCEVSRRQWIVRFTDCTGQVNVPVYGAGQRTGVRGRSAYRCTGQVSVQVHEAYKRTGVRDRSAYRCTRHINVSVYGAGKRTGVRGR